MAFFAKPQNYSISGKITSNNQALPFASIFIKGSTIGVSSNEEGSYKIELAPANYTLVFQYVGFKRKEVTLSVTENQTLNIDLQNDGISLSEVVVKAGEDPAYNIIKKAIKKRHYYLEQVKMYSCQSYIKGLQRLKYIPNRLKKIIKATSGEKIDSSKLGVIYLSESESNYFFEAPDKEKEIMFSSRISGRSNAFSFNQLRQMKFNFYNNFISIRSVSDRPFISPLNANALMYYKFYLLSSTKDANSTIHKIKVSPKRKTDPCFTGIIYIEDSLWRITSLDLEINTNQKLNFIDTLKIKQLFTNINDSVLMPVNFNFNFSFKVFGVTGNGYFNAIVKNYNLKPIIKKDFFNNEVFVIQDSANKKDSSYWLKNRPLPLTSEEKKDYRKKDSAEKIHNTTIYKDSIDANRNKFRIANIFMGYSYYKTKSKISFEIPGILTNGLQYNTIEGVNIISKIKFSKSYENYKSHIIDATARYGFANYLWGGAVTYNYHYNPKKFAHIIASFKNIVEQFNKQEPIMPLVNSLYTLLINDNFLKLYKETGGEIKHTFELANGLYVESVASYYKRDALQNKSFNVIIDDKSKWFTSNNPIFPNSDYLAFTSNNALCMQLSLTYRFKQKYISAPYRKIITGKRFPRFNLTYQKALPYMGSTVSYDFITAMAYNEINWGLLGRTGIRLKGGYFLSNDNMYFMDYKHFLTNQTIAQTNDYLSSFKLMPYYLYSTNNWFAEAHAEHSFNGFIFNKIPLLKKIKAQEVIGFHYLKNDKINNYTEINFGIENIWRVIRIDYIISKTNNGAWNNGFTFGLNFGL
ncbi:MAG: carboxypeptidase-like regulatory domain-containing protein [Bacteroidetes bacterium]|nr:carboxypeptidase-like regulatory domain-containing protein [Bacteroidota bacterium]